ncbi:MAG TPA: GNAT family N-acetyltransferase [Acetobacteraceae bacterium]|nr:GNAT family N-acetyltransferase [Acetobacteraceae bacterium]
MTSGDRAGAAVDDRRPCGRRAETPHRSPAYGRHIGGPDRDGSGDGYLLIANVAVSPALQNRGLGRRLLAHAEQLAAAQAHPVIRLFTNKLFAANVQLYRKLGYGVDREERPGPGITVYMSKPVQIEGRQTEWR